MLQPWQTLPYDPAEAAPMDVPDVPPGVNPFAGTEESDEEHCIQFSCCTENCIFCSLTGAAC